MEEIKLSAKDMQQCAPKIKAYIEREFDYDIGNLEAEMLIDFLSKELGPFFYNRGLNDAHTLFSDKADELGYLIQELEKPTY